MYEEDDRVEETRIDDEPTITDLPPFEPPTVAPDEDEPAPPRRPGRGWLLPALVGALVGALVAGGIVAAVEDDDASAPAAVAPGGTRNTSRVERPQDIKGILDRIEPAVVSISTRGFAESDVFGIQPQQGAGTGIVISADGLVLTNAHVVSGATSIKIRFADGKERDAVVLGAIASSDVALVRTSDASGLPVAELGRSSELTVGDDVVAVGNALGLSGDPTVTLGIVSALGRTIDTEQGRLEGVIQTDAAINPGNSGGPLVDDEGRVVGINTAIAGSGQNIGFAIAIDTVKPLIDQLKDGGGQTAQAFLGVSSRNVNESVAEQLGLDVTEGALVLSVTPGSPAENAGIRPGDVVTRIGDEEIATSDDLVAAVRTHEPGEKVRIVLHRGGEEETVTATLGSRPLIAR